MCGWKDVENKKHKDSLVLKMVEAKHVFFSNLWITLGPHLTAFLVRYIEVQLTAPPGRLIFAWCSSCQEDLFSDVVSQFQIKPSSKHPSYLRLICFQYNHFGLSRGSQRTLFLPRGPLFARLMGNSFKNYHYHHHNHHHHHNVPHIKKEIFDQLCCWSNFLAILG